MITPHELLIASAATGAAGFVIGVLIKSVVDGMAMRDELKWRIQSIEVRLEDLEGDEPTADSVRT